MSQATNDSNYYDVLGVSPNATDAEIHAAYRALVVRFHPDRNPIANAEQLTVMLNHAWETLKDPERRKAYDATLPAETLLVESEEKLLDLPVCELCGAQNPTISSVVFTYVISFLFMSSRRQIAGLMCDACRSKSAIRSALLTVFFGWWGLPFGPVYSFQALYHAAKGGKRDGGANAVLKKRMGIAYRQREELNEALTCFESAAEFAQDLNRGLESELRELHADGAKRIKLPKRVPGQIVAAFLPLVFFGCLGVLVIAILPFTVGPTALQRCRQFNAASNFREALPFCDRALQHEPVADGYLQRAIARISLGDTGGALSDLSKSLALDPANAYALTLRCRAYDELGQPALALNDCDAAILTGASSGEAFSWRCFARIRLHDAQGALNDCDKAVSLAPDNPIAYSNRCSTYDDAGNYPKALADCNKAISLDPKAQPAYNNRCSVHLHANELPDALDDCNTAIALDPDNPTGYTNRCMVKNALRDHRAALRDCTQAVTLSPEASIAYRNRCRVYNDLHQYHPALADCNKSIALNRQDAIAYQHRCFTYLALHNGKAAQADCSKAIALDRALPYAYAGRAMARAAQGDPKAKNDLRTAREIYRKKGPGNAANEPARV